MSVDNSRATQDAEWLAGSEADTAERNLARAYLAMRDEVAGFTAMWEEREKAHDAEIAEAKRERDGLHTRLAAQSGYAEDDTIADLRERLARAERDTARLDWLEQNAGRVSGPTEDCPRFVVWGDTEVQDVTADTVRAAIDAAMIAMPTTGMSE